MAIILTLLLLGLNSVLTEAHKSPHIIVILVDDLGHDDVSFHGSNQIPTPNIDALAYDGITLNNYYTNRICTPSRAALMTGRHPTQLGLQHDVIGSSTPYGLALNETLLPEYLKTIGYSTHIVGKWHLGYYAKEFTPTYRGFDSFLGYYTGKEDYYDHTRQGVYDSWGLDFRNNTEPALDKFGQYSTEIFAEEAVNIINHHDTSNPMFLYLPHQGVHGANLKVSPPLEAPWKYTSRFPDISMEARRIYAGMVAAVDDAVGNVTRALHAKGMLNDSVIFLSTDNGGPANGFDKNQASNWPLRGMKFTVWEGGMRGNGLIWSPRLETSGYVSEHMLQIEDMMPTLLHAAGYDTASLPEFLYGKDMWDVLSHNLPGPRHEMLHNIDPVTKEKALRIGDMKVITSGPNQFTANMDGWYYPPQADEARGVAYKPTWPQQFGNDSSGTSDLEMDLNTLRKYRAVDDSSENYILDRKKPISADIFKSDLPDILSSMGRKVKVHAPVKIKCGEWPVNETHKCQVGIKPCLFNITADPCEYRNLAASRPDLLQVLLKRMKQYEEASAQPRNKPPDPKGLPKYFNGVWSPWIKLTHDQLVDLRKGKDLG